MISPGFYRSLPSEQRLSTTKAPTKKYFQSCILLLVLVLLFHEIEETGNPGVGGT